MVHRLDRKVKADKGISFIEAISSRELDKDAFMNYEISRYGTTLFGTLDRYRDSPAEAILDLVNNDSRYRAYHDIRIFDFPNVRNIWTKKNGAKNKKLAREATGQLARRMMRRHHWTRKQFVENIGHWRFTHTNQQIWNQTSGHVPRGVSELHRSAK